MLKIIFLKYEIRISDIKYAIGRSVYSLIPFYLLVFNLAAIFFKVLSISQSFLYLILTDHSIL